MTYSKYEFTTPVPLLSVHEVARSRYIDLRNVSAPLEVWVDTDSEPVDGTFYVQIGLNTKVGDLSLLGEDAVALLGDQMLMLDGPTATAVAELLHQRLDFDKFGLDGWDFTDARIKASWDSDGVDLKLAFADQEITLAVDDADLIDRVADAISECAAIILNEQG